VGAQGKKLYGPVVPRRVRFGQQLILHPGTFGCFNTVKTGKTYEKAADWFGYRKLRYKTILMDETGVCVRAKTIEYDTIVQKPGWSEMRRADLVGGACPVASLVLDGVEPLCACGH
jgi:hypothetical protein